MIYLLSIHKFYEFFTLLIIQRREKKYINQILRKKERNIKENRSETIENTYIS